jgi:hypothetical protein
LVAPASDPYANAGKADGQIMVSMFPRNPAAMKTGRSTSFS